jgi:hypothetical protein
MKIRMSAASLLAVSLLGGSALAEDPVLNQSPTLWTANTYTDRSVWVTVYDLGKLRHLDYGCMGTTGFGIRHWTSGHYAFGSFYYIRGEVMEGKDCSGRKLCDTTVQANPQIDANPGRPRDQKVRGRNTQWYIQANGNNCYWAQSSWIDQYSIGKW